MASLDLSALRRGVREAVSRTFDKPGVPAPQSAATAYQLDIVCGLVKRLVWKEYQARVIRKVRTTIDASADPDAACLKGLQPHKVLGKGIHGSAWLLKDEKTVAKVGEVVLEKEHSVTRDFDRARREFAISRAAGEAGVAPKVKDTFFCCSTDDACYYVIVMDYVPGVDLHTWNKTANAQKKIEMRERLLRRTARLLEAGIEHMDLHDGNIIVTPSGDPVIIDFSLADWARKTDGKEDADSINRIYSKTESMEDIVRYVALTLLSNGTVKLNSNNSTNNSNNSNDKKPDSIATKNTRKSISKRSDDSKGYKKSSQRSSRSRDD